MIIRVCCSSHPVAIAPGSVFVDPRCQFLRLHAGLVAPCFWLHFTSFRKREERGKTNTEPGAVATGIILHDHSSLLFKPPGRLSLPVLYSSTNDVSFFAYMVGLWHPVSGFTSHPSENVRSAGKQIQNPERYRRGLFFMIIQVFG